MECLRNRVRLNDRNTRKRKFDVKGREAEEQTQHVLQSLH